MSRFTLVESKGRGRPRENRSDLTGQVRIAVVLSGYTGNITRSFTVKDAKVSAVSKALVAALASGKVRPVVKPATVPPVPASAKGTKAEAVASAS
jgi:hypothetical protein